MRRLWSLIPFLCISAVIILKGCGGGSGSGSPAVNVNINFTSDGNGTLGGSTSQSVSYNASASEVSAIPATGYHFVNWTGDNGFATSTDNPLTVANVTASHTITAHFAIDASPPTKVVVNFTSGGNGTLGGSTSQSVSYNASASEVSAIPATGYHFVNWTGDNGFATSTDNPLTVVNVTASHTITAHFAIDASPPSKVIVKLSTQGTLPQGSLLSGIDVTVKLPAGVSVKTDVNGAVESGVVSVSGVAAPQGGSTVIYPLLFYTPALATAPATLRITFGTSYFSTGEFATINCDLAPGSSAPSATDLAVTDYSLADQGLHPVTSLSVALTVELK